MNEEFEHPRLAAVYDVLDPDRSDLRPYLELADQLGARRVADVGCGTGVFALQLAARGVEVIGVDPARASLDVARAKPGAARVRWLLGDAVVLAAEHVRDVDLATMTANVAMFLQQDADAAATVSALAGALRPGGHVVFETRRPDYRAWERWNPDTTRHRAALQNGGWAESVIEVTTVRWPWVEFTDTVRFDDGTSIVSTATLRYRELEEWTSLLAVAGFDVVRVTDAPDRPGREWVVLAELA